MILPEYIIASLNNKTFYYHSHFYKRQQQRNLRNINVIPAILNGEVIESLKRFNNGEHYIVHCVENSEIFHIVLEYDDGTLLLKTIYTPDKNHFEDDLKTRLNGNLLKK
jgi:uncharacterized protein DUF4258